MRSSAYLCPFPVPVYGCSCEARYRCLAILHGFWRSQVGSPRLHSGRLTNWAISSAQRIQRFLMANYLTLSWTETHSKDGHNLAREGLGILLLRELSIAEPSKGQQPRESTRATPKISISIERFGVGSDRLLSLQPKVLFHLETMLSAWFRTHTNETYAQPPCLERCWHETVYRLKPRLWILFSSLLVTVTVGGKQHLLGLYDTAGQVWAHVFIH